VNIAIFDAGGNLKHFKRMDGSFLGSIEIAHLKGHTAAIFPRSTRARGELAYGGDRPHGIELVPGIVVFPGGLPIMAGDGHQVGGIGVSGATSDQDEQCAQAAIDAVADRL
ncbi:MAG: PduO protein, partial [Rhodospirillaceae bacterium]|nr:PduO protein [Rhodospirillaceae bacterium]